MEMGVLIGFLILVIVIVIVLWGAKIAMEGMELPPNVKKLVLVILSLVALVILIVRALAVFGGTHVVIW